MIFTATSQNHQQAGTELLADLSRQNRNPVITSSSHDVDGLLGSGLLKEVTEISGVPGVGKAAWNAIMCKCADSSLFFFRGGGEAVYIDTEGSFTSSRLSSKIHSRYSK
jgi:RecA/RadA recombinase